MCPFSHDVIPVMNQEISEVPSVIPPIQELPQFVLPPFVPPPVSPTQVAIQPSQPPQNSEILEPPMEKLADPAPPVRIVRLAKSKPTPRVVPVTTAVPPVENVKKQLKHKAEATLQGDNKRQVLNLNQKKTNSSANDGLKIRSFEEIMAEKKQHRQQNPIPQPSSPSNTVVPVIHSPVKESNAHLYYDDFDREFDALLSSV
eukprot:c9565_g1_i2.p1 GENE.c9565_g1_i2~~c9565_g1_i2.p1  ORF type:complete len:201 (-),score=36.59 c9565_g1_i2:2-604(-)